ncbi:MAG: DUF2927 domain-containing protein [Pseudomonadota bacterium]
MTATSRHISRLASNFEDKKKLLIYAAAVGLCVGAFKLLQLLSVSIGIIYGLAIIIFLGCVAEMAARGLPRSERAFKAVEYGTLLLMAILIDAGTRYYAPQDPRAARHEPADFMQLVELQTFTDAELTAGYLATAFRGEDAGLRYNTEWGDRIARFRQPFTVYVSNEAGRRTRAAENFLDAFRLLFPTLQIRRVDTPEDGQLRIFLMDHELLRSTRMTRMIRAGISVDGLLQYRGVKADLRCSFTQSGHPGRGEIAQSSVVIALKPWTARYNRCVFRTVLQAMGLFYSDDALYLSLFNPNRPGPGLPLFDIHLLNLHYHPDLQPGMTRAAVRQVLPGAIASVRTQLAPLRARLVELEQEEAR